MEQTIINLGTDSTIVGWLQIILSILSLLVTGGIGVWAVITASKIGKKQIKLSRQQHKLFFIFYI